MKFHRENFAVCFKLSINLQMIFKVPLEGLYQLKKARALNNKLITKSRFKWSTLAVKYKDGGSPYKPFILSLVLLDFSYKIYN